MTDPLTPASLARLRTEAERHLPGTAVVQSAAGTANQGGGRTSGFTAVGTIPCRIAPLAGQELDAAERMTAMTEAIVTVPVSADVSVQQQLLIDGRTWEIVNVKPRKYETTRRIEVKEIA
jgi:head-tail adaptor